MSSSRIIGGNLSEQLRCLSLASVVDFISIATFPPPRIKSTSYWEEVLQYSIE